MIRIEKNHARLNILRFRKKVARKRKLKQRRSGWFKFYQTVLQTAKSKGLRKRKAELPRFKAYSYQSIPNSTVPPSMSETIKYLSENKVAFSKASVDMPKGGVFHIPIVFSLTSNYEESFLFLKKLFFALFNDRFSAITIDYAVCQRIDIDASACMDIMLQEFLDYHDVCARVRYPKKLRLIKGINIKNLGIRKMLASIGATKNIGKKEIKFQDVIPFALQIGDNRSAKRGRDKEIEVTKMVDYILDCLKRTSRTLTWQAEDRLSKVIGEVLINAAEHSGGKSRYSIGYFEESQNDSEKVGIFNLAIFDFGKTIYQNFKNQEGTGVVVVERMKELSSKYKKRGFFQAKEFEEETLWTLYSLQEGVTSVAHSKRGSGSIQFIESFFALKGDQDINQGSHLTLLSGNTRITFDGTYKIEKKMRGKDKKLYKMMTFNASGNIEDPPDKKYVTFTENFFPGTLIVAKILIKFKNTEFETSNL